MNFPKFLVDSLWFLCDSFVIPLKHHSLNSNPLNCSCRLRWQITLPHFYCTNGVAMADNNKIPFLGQGESGKVKTTTTTIVVIMIIGLRIPLSIDFIQLNRVNSRIGRIRCIGRYYLCVCGYNRNVSVCFFSNNNNNIKKHSGHVIRSQFAKLKATLKAQWKLKWCSTDSWCEAHAMKIALRSRLGAFTVAHVEGILKMFPPLIE